MNLGLLKLHAVVAKVQLIHVVSAEALTFFNVLDGYFIFVLQFWKEMLACVGFGENVVFGTYTRLHLSIGHLPPHFVKVLKFCSRYPYILQVNRLVK